MRELAHDGCLLEELDSTVFLCSSLQQLDGHLPLSSGTLPHPLVDCTKLPRTKVLLYPDKQNNCESQVYITLERVNGSEL